MCSNYFFLNIYNFKLDLKKASIFDNSKIMAIFRKNEILKTFSFSSFLLLIFFAFTAIPIAFHRKLYLKKRILQIIFILLLHE